MNSMRKLSDVTQAHSYTPQAAFSFRIIGHDDLDFEVVELDGNTQNEPLVSGLLIPFLKRFCAFMSMRATCSAVAVNGKDLTLTQLKQRIRDFVDSRNFTRKPTEIILTLDLTPDLLAQPSIKKGPIPVSRATIQIVEGMKEDIANFEKRRGLRILGSQDVDPDAGIAVSPPSSRRQASFNAFFSSFANQEASSSSPVVASPSDDVVPSSPHARRSLEASGMSSDLDHFDTMVLGRKPWPADDD